MSKSFQQHDIIFLHWGNIQIQIRQAEKIQMIFCNFQAGILSIILMRGRDDMGYMVMAAYFNLKPIVCQIFY